MNVVVFASDAKGLSSLNSLIIELGKNSNIKYYALVCPSTELKDPKIDRGSYKEFTNVKESENVWCEHLNTHLPFIPDWLIINREKWPPEAFVMQEFKQKWNSKVGVVEPNGQLLNSIESILETHSRNRFVPFIDVFFDHSVHISYQRNLVGFKGKSIVVGNHKYDINLTPNTQSIDFCKQFYKIDPNKKQVLLFSLQNTNRNAIYNEYEKYIKENPNYQYFIKPYPGEPFSDKFKKDYFPEFKIKGVTPILEESHIWPMFNICDIHVGCIMSILHASLLLKKEIVDLSKKIDLPNKYIDVNRIMNSTNIGIEDSKELWMRSFGKSEEELMELFPDKLLEYVKRMNNKVWNHRGYLLSLFDDFNDGKAAERIVKHLIQ